MHGRIPDNSFFPYLLPPGLKLGLDQTDHLAPGSHQVPYHRQNLAQGNKGNINGYEGRSLCQLLRGQIANVGTLHTDYPGIIAQLPIQLTVADIHRIDLDRPILQHAVRKPSGGASHIHANLPCQAQSELFYRLGQLQTSPTDIGKRIPLDRNGYRICKGGARFILPLSLYQHLACHDNGFGLLPGGCQISLHQHNIQTFLPSAFFCLSCHPIPPRLSSHSPGPLVYGPLFSSAWPSRLWPALLIRLIPWSVFLSPSHPICPAAFPRLESALEWNPRPDQPVASANPHCHGR